MTALLLTGIPGIGKTTIIRKVAESLSGYDLAGFVTDEIRTERGREGFRLITFDGQEATMAHVDFRTRYRVGRYGVDVQTVDRLVKSALRLLPHAGIYLVDEIGKMECFSSAFVAGMRSALDSGRPVVASIARKGEGLVGEVKRRRDCVLWEVTHHNRNAMPERVLDWIKGTLAHPPG
jgi:nucleoside-triphosphatase